MIVFFTTTFSEPPSQLKVPIDGLSTTNTVGEALNVFCNKIGVRNEDVEVSLAEGVPVARLTLPLSSLQKSQPTDTNEQQDEELHLLAHCTVPLPVTVAQWDADIRKDAEEKTLIPPSPVANIVAVRPNRIHKSRGSTDALVERRDGNEEALPVVTQPIVISEPLTDAGQGEDDVCSPVIKMMPDDRKTVLLAITNDGTHSVDEGNPLEPKIPTQEATVVARRNHQFTRLVSSAYPTIVRATAPRLAAAVARDPLLAHLCHTSPSLLTSARSSVASSTTGGDLSARSTPYQSQFSYYRACLAVAVRYGVLLGPSGDISQPIIPHGEDCPPEDWLAELDQDVQSCTSARTTSTTSDDVPLVALYSELAGVRHSCWPNCVLCINSTTRPYGASCRCSSLDGIAQGERITCLMKSVDSMGFFLLSPERRRAMLRRHYRVACDCNRCTNAAENAVEQSLTAIFFRPEAEKELCVDVLQQDFDKLNLLRESTMQLTLCDVDHRIVLERREARLVRLQEFLTKYTEDSPVLKLGVCHWRVNLARAAYLQEAALLIQRSDSFRSRMEDSAEDFFNLLEICEQQLTVEHLLIPPGHPYGLISYWCGNHIAGGNLRGALHAQPNMEEGRDLDSVAERINWEALERSDAAWRELRGGTSIPHALRALMDAFADY